MVSPIPQVTLPIQTERKITIFSDLLRIQNHAVFESFATREEHYSTHINCSREMILSQLDSLNKTSKVVVLGPGYLEPLAELADRCSELVLVNYDKTSLKQLSKALSRSNVKIKKMDFTGGLFKQIEEHMQLAMKQNWTAEHFFKVIVSTYASYRPSRLFEDDLLKDADYVVSSLIASQFTLFADEALVKFFEEQFNINIAVFLGNLSESERNEFNQAQRELTDHLIVQYAKTLGTLIKSTGRIYLSDTTSVVEKIYDHTLRSSIQVIHPLIDGSNLDKIEQHFHVLETKKWEWLARPTMSISYEVRAYLLEKNQNSG